MHGSWPVVAYSLIAPIFSFFVSNILSNIHKKPILLVQPPMILRVAQLHSVHGYLLDNYSILVGSRSPWSGQIGAVGTFRRVVL